MNEPSNDRWYHLRAKTEKVYAEALSRACRELQRERAEDFEAAMRRLIDGLCTEPFRPPK